MCSECLVKLYFCLQGSRVYLPLINAQYYGAVDESRKLNIVSSILEGIDIIRSFDDELGGFRYIGPKVLQEKDEEYFQSHQKEYNLKILRVALPIIEICEKDKYEISPPSFGSDAIQIGNVENVEQCRLITNRDVMCRCGFKKRMRCKKCTRCMAPKCGKCRPCNVPLMKKPCENQVCMFPIIPRCPCFAIEDNQQNSKRKRPRIDHIDEDEPNDQSRLDEIEELKQKLNDLSGEMNQKNQEVDDLQEKVDQKNQIIHDLTKENVQKNQELDNLQEKVDRKNQVIHDVTEENVQKNQKLAIQRGKCDTFENQQNILMRILNIPENERNFGTLHEALENLKNDYVAEKERAEHLATISENVDL